MSRLAFVLLLLVVLFSVSAIVAADGSPPHLRLRLATFDIAQASSLGIPKELTLESYTAGVQGLYVVQFSGPLVTEQREALEDAGAVVLGYLPDYAYLVVMGDEALARVSSWSMDGSYCAVSVGIYQPAFKIEPSLLDACSGDDEWPAIIVQQYGESEDDLMQLYGAALESGADVDVLGSSIWGTKQRLALELHKDDLCQFVTQMARRPNVVWIEEHYAPEVYNYQASYVTQCYKYRVWSIWDHGIHGEGQIAAVADTGLDADMCFFYDETQGLPTSSINHNQRKTIVYYDWVGDGKWDNCETASGIAHGTHVAGSIAQFAEGNYTYEKFKGMAYQAKLVIQDVGDFCTLPGIPYDLNDLFQQAMDAGARLHNNSWGTPGSNAYNRESQDVDEFMWANPTFLIAFAVGNSGTALHTVSPPSTAKSCIAVGASGNIDVFHHNSEDVAYFSSHGPTEDGRISPTLCTPGFEIASADGDQMIFSFQCKDYYAKGTSMASPVLVGNAALVRQYYTDGYYPTGQANASDGFEPSAALMKATLINSGMELTGSNLDGSLPDTAQGWGRVVLDDTLYFADDEGALAAYDVSPGLSTGETDYYHIECDGSLKLEISLVWTDYPSSLSAGVNLVNDLDLTVTSPGSVTYLGNNYSEGQSAPGGSLDRLNIVECVQIDEPEAGVYEIAVNAHNTPEGPQPYALVITLDEPTRNKGVSDGSVTPKTGGENTTFIYSVYYYDIYDTQLPAETNVYIDDEPHEMTLSSGETNDGIYTFETTLPAGVHTYYFQFTDFWANTSRLPRTGYFEGPVIDELPPQSTCSCGKYSCYPIKVSFSASDAESSVAKTDLYYKFEDGDWEFSGESEGGTTGTLSFEPSDGEGTYYFYTIATDIAGNIEDAPETHDAETQHDATEPWSVCSGPESAWETFELSFVASDGEGSGVGETSLWYRYEDESWAQSGEPASGDSGKFTFTSEHEDGSYFFYTIAADLAGNQEPAPDEPDCEVPIRRIKPKSNCIAPQFSNHRDVSIEYVVTECQAEIESVSLWYRYESGAWTDTEQDETGETGTFEFHIPHGEGEYHFYTISKDSAGTVEDAPDIPDTTLMFDITDPISSCASPACAPSSEFPVAFDSSDAGSGVSETSLWVKFEDGDWEDTGLSLQGLTGEFDFVGQHGEGEYFFHTISQDWAENVETPPDEYDSNTIVDSTAPSSVCLAPPYSSTVFTITFEAEDDGCGINLVSLLWRFDGGSWSEWHKPGRGEVGEFHFVPSEDDGLLEFYTSALDLAGNREQAPATADTVTLFDTTCASSSCTCPKYSSLATIIVEFQASDAGSGVVSTWLWYRTDDGEFLDSGLESAGHSSIFEFLATEGEGPYEFYTISVDRAANKEEPAPAPDASCILDQTAPRSSCTSPDLANVSPIVLDFASEDALSGVSYTMLFFKFEDGDWEDMGLSQSGPEGQFSFSVPYSAGTYQFASVCCDRAGNVESLPDAPDCAAFFDERIPVSHCSSPPLATETTIVVSYEANGGESGLVDVRLWYAFESGEAQDCGLVATESEGAFEFVADQGDGRYGFFTVSSNVAGMIETNPAALDSFTLLDRVAPSSFCTAPLYSTSATLTVQYETLDDISLIAGVDLYYRYEGGDWHYYSTAPSGEAAGTFEFSIADEEGVWGFATAAHDRAGNVEELPDEADAVTFVDHTPPEISVSAPAWASESTLSIHYTASDVFSGSANVTLWYQFEEGGWQETDLNSGQPSGSLEFLFGDGEGHYEFWVEASDTAQNSTGEPDDAQASTVYDKTPPSSHCEAPELTRSSLIMVSFEAEDTLCSELLTRLVYRLDGGSWHSFADVEEGPSGEFVFEAEADGLYEFYSVSTDLAGNSESVPEGNEPDCATVLDTVPPVSSCKAPSASAEPKITVTFSASDETSGVAETALWVSFDGGTWKDTGLSEEGETGEFTFTFDQGEGVYSFYTVCEDAAANVRVPDEAQTSTIHDVTAPASSCSSPKYATDEFEVSFTTEEFGSGIDSVSLLYKFGSSGWVDTGLVSNQAFGAFTFEPRHTDGTYSFATRALDLAGNQQGQPSQADCKTVFDTERPASASDCVELTNQRQVEITFEASDDTSGIARVALYSAFEDGSFKATGDSSTSDSGSFEFNLNGADGRYSFYSIATDKAGLSQAKPAEPHCTVLLDTVAPVSTCEAPDSTEGSSVQISFTASDEGSGVAETSLFYRLSGARLWVDTGLSSPGCDGTFKFRFPDGGGWYEFRPVAVDVAGNEEAPGADACCGTHYRTGSPALSVAVGSHDFGALAIGDIRTWEITLANTGKTDLVVDSVEATGGSYYVGGPGTFTLGPSKQIGLNLFFFPTSDPPADGELTIRSNDPSVPVKTVLLSGMVSTSDRPFLTITTDRPEYHLGDTICAFFTLRNPGPETFADAYAAIRFPGDPTLYFLTGLTPTPSPVSLFLPQGAYIPPTMLLGHAIDGPLPEGNYELYAALCKPGPGFEFVSDLSIARFRYK